MDEGMDEEEEEKRMSEKNRQVSWIWKGTETMEIDADLQNGA
jgi:hypothetical protein